VSEHNQQKIDFNTVFGSDVGKKVLLDILSFAHVVEPPVADHDPHVVMLKAGRRDTAMFILERMGFTPSDFVDLVSEDD